MSHNKSASLGLELVRKSINEDGRFVALPKSLPEPEAEEDHEWASSFKRASTSDRCGST